MCVYVHICLYVYMCIYIHKVFLKMLYYSLPLFPQKNVGHMKHSYLTWEALSRYFIALEEAATDVTS